MSLPRSSPSSPHDGDDDRGSERTDGGLDPPASPTITRRGVTAQTVTRRGVVFRRTIRASYATLDVVVAAADGTDGSATGVGGDGGGSEQRHVTILLQFRGRDGNAAAAGNSCSTATACRSQIRRLCKLGAAVEVRGGRWLPPPPQHASASAAGRLEVPYSLPPNEDGGGDVPSLRVLKAQEWDTGRCQAALAKYYPALSRRGDGHGRGKAGDGGRTDGAEDAAKSDIATTTTSMNERKKKGRRGQTGVRAAEEEREDVLILVGWTVWNLAGTEDEGNYGQETTGFVTNFSPYPIRSKLGSKLASWRL